MTPYTFLNNDYQEKVVVKSTPDLPDVGDLPLGVVSLARISPDGSSGPGKKCPMTLGTIPNSSYLAKVAEKSKSASFVLPRSLLNRLWAFRRF